MPTILARVLEILGEPPVAESGKGGLNHPAARQTTEPLCPDHRATAMACGCSGVLNARPQLGLHFSRNLFAR
jgi:hypothetical protein